MRDSLLFKKVEHIDQCQDMEFRILDHPLLSLQDKARMAGEMVEKCSCGVAIV